jgi:hypothetical protein
MQNKQTIKTGKQFNKKCLNVLAHEFLFEAHVREQNVRIKNFKMEA